MATEFKLPELGENVHGGDVLRVLVKPGDTVKSDQPVLELETDKATIEVPSAISGTIAEIKVRAGEKVKVGQIIFTVSDGAAAAGDGSPAKAADTKEDAQLADAAAEGGQSQPARTDRGQLAAAGEETADSQRSVSERPR